MTVPRDATGALPPTLRKLYRITSLIWAVYAVGLALWAHGSVLLRFADLMRPLITVLAVLVAVAMVLRAVVPGRPEWTRWTLPLIIGASVSTFTLTLFGIEIAGDLTSARAGMALLALMPAAFAHVHYMGEKVVAPR